MIFLDFILHNFPYFESIKPFFITTHIGGWGQIFIHHIPWRDIGVDMAYLGTLDVTFLVIGAVAFSQRDFKS